MSEAKSSKKKDSKAKADAAPKAESKSADAAPKAKESAASESAASTDTKSPESGKDSGSEKGKEAGKSARESAGGKSDVHYGYFSSVRTPAYRSGWDAIWGSDNGDDASNGDETPRQSRQRATRARGPAKPRKRREPITVTLDLDDLPPDLKDGLVEIASAPAQGVPRELRAPRQGRRHRLAHHLPRGLRGPGRAVARSARPTMPLSNVVMPALVAGIHVLCPCRTKNSWMAGTSPAMTCGGCAQRLRQAISVANGAVAVHL